MAPPPPFSGDAEPAAVVALGDPTGEREENSEPEDRFWIQSWQRRCLLARASSGSGRSTSGFGIATAAAASGEEGGITSRRWRWRCMWCRWPAPCASASRTRSSSPTLAPAASTPSSTAPQSPSLEHKGCVTYAHKGCEQDWMQPLVHDFGNLDWHNSREIRVSSISDPVSATFCEPVEKANSSHSFTAGLVHSVGLRKQPLRVYSMVKYAAGVVIIQEAGGMITDAEAGR